jgi:RNA polymerase sigma-70 factor (ECF subfamily)
MDSTCPSLLERLKRPDDAAAWERFVELYSPILHYWAGRSGLDEADAADLVQDVFVLLVEKLPHLAYDPQRRFRGWLWTVTRNKVRERMRKAGSPAGERVPVEDLAAPDPGDPLADEEYRTMLVDRALRLMQTDFRPRTWQACWQNIMEGKSAAEVGLSEGALWAAKFRVLSRLRRELAGLWD